MLELKLVAGLYGNSDLFQVIDESSRLLHGSFETEREANAYISKFSELTNGNAVWADTLECRAAHKSARKHAAEQY